MSPSANYGGWVIMICQYRFINCNEYSTQVQDVDNKGGCACVGTGRMWEVIHSARIRCKPKIALKK